MRILSVLLVLASIAHAQYNRPRPQQVYYIATTGNDANPGTSASPWASPNHALNCGDVIIAQTGTYAASNFASGKWGTVTCAAGNSVVWLVCATFDACKITATGTAYGMYVDRSYWGVSGWEVSTAATGFTCFAAAPPSSGAVAGVHHIVFANDIANGCGGGGFSTFNVGSFSVDYFAAVGDIAYNAAQNSLNCYSGFTTYQPIPLNANSGPHIFFGGDYGWGNVDPNPCAGTTPTNGDFLILDSIQGDNPGGATGVPFTQYIAVKNNIGVCNGSSGFEVQTYTKNPTTPNNVLFANNTAWGNLTDGNINTNLCAGSKINKAYGIAWTANIDQVTSSTACTAHTAYGFYAFDTATSGSSYSTAPLTTFTNNFIQAASAQNVGSFNDETPANTFVQGSGNTTGTSPAFSAPACPPAPSCGTASSVADCMGTVISHFTPTAGGTSGKGYQVASLTNGTDQANYPQWLCQTGLPAGLYTPNCL